MRRFARASDLIGDFFARAKTRIEKTLFIEYLERLTVILEMLGLTADGALPFKTKPDEILYDRFLELGPAARAIYILHP
jgi:hypothetical protein